MIAGPHVTFDLGMGADEVRHRRADEPARERAEDADPHGSALADLGLARRLRALA